VLRISLRPWRDFLGVLCGQKLLTAKVAKKFRTVREEECEENKAASIS
jgi:hypothetical protein